MPSRTYYTHTDTPIGRLLLVSDGTALTGLHFAATPKPDWSPDAGPFAQVVAELGEYFAGTRTAFTVPVNPAGGTAFQRAAWEALRSIPYGQTVSYAEQARRLGRPAAVRAVGAANGRNPVAIVLPCHRVIGSGGKLVGFGGGLPLKAKLLALEGASGFGS